MMEHLQPDNTTGGSSDLSIYIFNVKVKHPAMKLFVSNTAETNQFILVNSRYPVSSPDNW